MRKPTVPNKYNLTPAIIRTLRINRDMIQQPPFWRNTAISAWCLSGNTARTAADHEFCTYNEYWLGIYDEDAKAHAGKIRVTFSAHGGMCSYTFKEFYNPKEIENELDLRIQEMFLSVMNRLIDEGIFQMPKEG